MTATTRIVTSVTPTLAASTVDTMTFLDTHSQYEIVNLGSADIWFTCSQGTPATPTVAGADCQLVRAGEALMVDGSNAVFKLISSGTPQYHLRAVK